MERDLLMTRRELLATAAALSVISCIPPGIQAASVVRDIPLRRLGRTGEEVSLLGLGGFHIGVQEKESDSNRIIRAAIDAGVTFMDNCWDYNDGRSEIRMGKALRDGYREKAFLMTKIDGRDRTTAMKQIEDSLQRLQTDRIDLLQIHEVIRMSDPDRLFAAGGAMEALLQARHDGKIRYIGFTGHKDPDIHLKMLETAFRHDFVFDTVQMPLNVMDAHFRSFERKVLPVLIKHRIGVIGMKPMGDSFILKSKAVSPVECLHYAMSLPTSVVVTGCDSLPILNQALRAAQNFKPLNDAKIAAILRKTAKFAHQGEYELYKTSTHFDGTEHNPQWLG